ncbi:MAG: addiction module protein [Bdellovibrionota bacterium]
MSKFSIADLLDLSVAERIRLAQDIWDSVVAIPQDIKISDEQRIELDKRFADFRKSPDDGTLWDQLKVELLATK